MKPIKQTRNFSVCLYKRTLPKNALYGSVYKTVWYCTDFKSRNERTASGKIRQFYKIVIYDDNNKQWVKTDTRKYPAIFVRIRDFMKTAEFINEEVVYCYHYNRAVKESAQREIAAQIKAAHQKERENREFLRDAGAPVEKRAQTAFMYKPGSQARVDGMGYNCAHYELTSGLDIDGYNGFDGITAREVSGYVQWFEQGQNTCGDLSEDCPYTRSGFETRDGIKVRLADFAKLYENNHAQRYDYVKKPEVAIASIGAPHIDRDPVEIAKNLFNTNEPTSAQIQYASAWK